MTKIAFFSQNMAQIKKRRWHYFHKVLILLTVSASLNHHSWLNRHLYKIQINHHFFAQKVHFLGLFWSNFGKISINHQLKTLFFYRPLAVYWHGYSMCEREFSHVTNRGSKYSMVNIDVSTRVEERSTIFLPDICF